LAGAEYHPTVDPGIKEAALMLRPRRLTLPVLLVIAATLATAPPAVFGQADQVTWGVHISLAPTWFDPAETSGMITPYMIYYALHDALAKPMPGQQLAPSLAESWIV
jgi:peptide/nickel transport system substrate-binding protein